MQYSRLHSKRCRYFQITTNTSSIGCYFLACFLTPHLGFLTCFSLPAPMPWVFPLTSSLPHPVFSPQHINKLPGWVFLLAFLFLRPRRGFFRSPISLHAHFFLHNLATSFQSGFSRLLLSSYAHVVGFSACHFLSTPTFLPATQQ